MRDNSIDFENEPPAIEPAMEPERYELSEGPAYHFEIARRDFFKYLGGGAVVIFLVRGSRVSAQESGGGRRGGNAQPKELAAWLHIGEDGMITVFTGKVEVGQDIRTSLTQVVAEELRTQPASIQLVMGDTALTPFDAGTFGSLTTRVMSPQLRKVGAAARETLIDLAAAQMTADRAGLIVRDGKVTDQASNRSLTFGQLTKGQKLTKAISDDTPVTAPDKWKIAGTDLPKVNGRAIVTGRHEYTFDIKRPGMLHGKILRPASFESKLTSVETSQAEKIPGVTVVHDGDFVGVVASSQESAAHALGLIKPEWKPTPQPSSKELFDYLRKPPGERGGRDSEGRSNFVRGSIPDGLAAAHQKLERTYTVAYIAHAPLEPRAAVAEWTDGKLTVWTGTQRPFGVRSELASALHVAEERVRVIVPDTGSGYGGKHTGEAALEAARLAKAAGKPVKVTWSREEEFTWAYFRPAGVIDINCGATNEGMITAWEFHNYNSGASAIRPMYEIPNQRIEFHASDSPLRQGSYRGLAATANHFAREVQIDELAEKLKMDPLELRLKNLKDERLIAALKAAAAGFHWGDGKRTTGRGRGIAGGFEKGGYVATCAEVSVDRASGRVKIERVVTAFECGAIVNPLGLKNQIEGAVIQGIGGALFEAIDFADGKILNPRFSKYRVPRFSDSPVLETVLIDRKDLPSAGAGETPIVGLAPAVSNAIYDAVGVRLRSLPMVPNGLKT